MTHLQVDPPSYLKTPPLGGTLPSLKVPSASLSTVAPAAADDQRLPLSSRGTTPGGPSFVAHADIEPGQEWRGKMESALKSCDALVGRLHEAFRGSDRCDQEVGIAVGRVIPTVPIQYDIVPYAIFGEVEAVNANSSNRPMTLARNVVRVLLNENATAKRLTNAIVLGLACGHVSGGQRAKVTSGEAVPFWPPPAVKRNATRRRYPPSVGPAAA